MKRITLVLLTSIALGSTAYAADFYGTAPMQSPMAPVSDWTGFYIGVFGGAAFNGSDAGVVEIDQDLDGNFNEPIVGALATAFGSNFIGSHDGGGLFGIEAGYDHQMDNFVVGVVADISRLDYSDRQSAFSSTPATYTQETDVEWLATIRARAGYLVTDNALVYLHGGLAIADVDTSFSSTNPNGVSQGGSDDNFGFQVGAGVETKITDAISFGVEYAYTNLGDHDATTRFNNGPFAAVNPAGSDLRGSDETFDFHTVKASLKYRF